MKRWMAVALCIALFLAVMPWSVTADAVPLTLAQLQAKYPQGAYWNHTVGGTEDYTLTPCTHHTGNCTYNGSCGCNTYNNMAIQCMGFAYQLASLAYGCDPRTEWVTNKSASALDTLKAGDIVRYRGNTHSIFVTAVEGDVVTFADCNWDHQCGIRWNAIATKAELKASFTYVKSAPYALDPIPTLAVGYDANGGTIDTAVVAHTYRVLSQNGINMRADAGTDQQKLSALPHKTEFTVAVGDTKEAGDYVWGKTTYNGITGWVVISDFVEKIGDVTAGEWTLTDGLVCHSGGAPLCHMVEYGKPIEVLCVPDEVGLYREGYRFAGWNTAADGSGVTFAAGMTPEELCADGVAVTLYALWREPIRGDVDGDGRLNNRDLALMQRHLGGWDVAVTAEADVDGNGTVNNRDLGLLQRVLNGWKEEN